MKKFVCILGALVLAACATQETTKADADAHAACRNVDPPVGSHLVKRSDCGVTTSTAQTEQARREAELLQQQQIMRTTGPSQGKL
jgi:hypothetical protein